MKLRFASPNFAALLHRPVHPHPVRHHQPRRSYEGLLRAIQLVLMVVVALVCAKLIATGAVLALRAFSGFLS
jgi:hypothetical protein